MKSYGTYAEEREALSSERRTVEAAIASLPRGSEDAIAIELRSRGQTGTPGDVDAVKAERQRLIERQRVIDERMSQLKSLLRVEREQESKGGAPIRPDGSIDYGIVSLLVYGEQLRTNDLLADIAEELRLMNLNR